ncbi:hypothetical protein [Bradyrhizobium sp.]|uniref:hypothetical protein n=1 Tax=Bradyrhizobium sp. TaxID=376 RepID=UPI003C59EE9C
MPYWIKRILLKSGELVAEKELRHDENYFDGDAPVVGDVIRICCRDRVFDAKVIWGNWRRRDPGQDPKVIVPLRVQEI